MRDLHTDLIHEVFSYLSYRDLLCIQRVCKEWHVLVRGSSKLWRDFRAYVSKNDSKGNRLRKRAFELYNPADLRSLHMQYAFNDDNTIGNEPPWRSLTSQLQHLSIRQSNIHSTARTRINPFLNTGIQSEYSGLETLTLHGVGFTEDTLRFALPKLRKLKIVGSFTHYSFPLRLEFTREYSSSLQRLAILDNHMDIVITNACALEELQRLDISTILSHRVTFEVQTDQDSVSESSSQSSRRFGNRESNCACRYTSTDGDTVMSDISSPHPECEYQQQQQQQQQQTVDAHTEPQQQRASTVRSRSHKAIQKQSSKHSNDGWFIAPIANSTHVPPQPTASALVSPPPTATTTTTTGTISKPTTPQQTSNSGSSSRVVSPSQSSMYYSPRVQIPLSPQLLASPVAAAAAVSMSSVRAPSPISPSLPVLLPPSPSTAITFANGPTALPLSSSLNSNSDGTVTTNSNSTTASSPLTVFAPISDTIPPYVHTTAQTSTDSNVDSKPHKKNTQRIWYLNKLKCLTIQTPVLDRNLDNYPSSKSLISFNYAACKPTDEYQTINFENLDYPNIERLYIDLTRRASSSSSSSNSSGNPDIDLTPLLVPSIRNLEVYSATIPDTVRLPNLKELKYIDGGVTDMRFLETLDPSRVTHIDISSCALTNIENIGIYCENLLVFKAYDSLVTDFSPLAFCSKLMKVDISHCKTRDISFVLQLEHLKTLTLNYCTVLKDLSPLEYSNIKIIELNGCTAITDLSPLYTCSLLEEIYLGDNEYTRLATYVNELRVHCRFLKVIESHGAFACLVPRPKRRKRPFVLSMFQQQLRSFISSSSNGIGNSCSSTTGNCNKEKGSSSSSSSNNNNNSNNNNTTIEFSDVEIFFAHKRGTNT